MPILTRSRSVVAALSTLLATMAVVAATPQVSASSQQAVDSSKPTIYGHRGASGYRPEHTLGSYELAARMGADYIEPDLVSTKDHVLVARHENEISATTDVADHPEFADRKTTKIIEGVSTTGWFTEDFTLAELKTLRAKERLPEVRQHNTLYNGRYKILTFQEIIGLRHRLSRELHRKIGLIPELKHTTYFRSIGLPLEKPFVATLRHDHLDNKGAKLVVQAGDISCLKYLNKVIPNPLLQGTGPLDAKPADVLATGGTTTYRQMLTPAGLKAIARYADIVAVSKDNVISRNPDGTLGKPTSFVHDAHAASLEAAAYTFRNENTFLPTDLRIGDNPSDYGNALEEYRRFYATGLDAVFSDNTDTAKAARDEG
ncbi:glycerophosphodiester phosphodiesterase family protein [Stenotrophomonas sp. NPDC087984]